ncbi:MAG: glycosyltransferase family 2 protein [Rhodospirillales bacterium]|nr:glycosyltransferase family 2 protein [Rhodospirillales bacterium]
MTSLLVVIPCYNGEATLERTLASALAQPVAPMTVVIVDDASTDGSFKLAQSLAARDARVKALAMAVNSGPGAARNLGARSFPGDYLAFLDADDVYLPGALPNAIGFLEKDSRFDAVKFGFETEPPLDLAPAHYDITYNSIPSNMVVKRHVFDILGGFPEDPVFRGQLAGEDVAFYEGVQRLFNLARAADKLLSYSCPPGSHLFKLVHDCPVGADGQAHFPETPERAELGRAIGRYIQQGRDRLRLAARLWSQAGCPPEAKP